MGLSGRARACLDSLATNLVKWGHGHSPASYPHKKRDAKILDFRSVARLSILSNLRCLFDVTLEVVIGKSCVRT
jgi:hypothetical protein